MTSRFQAHLITFKSQRPITMGYPCVLHIHVLTVPCVISKLVALVTPSLEVEKKKPKCVPCPCVHVPSSGLVYKN